MEINYTVIKYNHYLIFDPIFSPFGHARQKLQHLSRSKNFGQILKSLLHVNHSWAMEIYYKVIKYNHYLIFDLLLRPFGHARQKLQDLIRSHVSKKQ
jgi:hemolysin-activating ACP:hemolysin acyltransferase